MPYFKTMQVVQLNGYVLSLNVYLRENVMLYELTGNEYSSWKLVLILSMYFIPVKQHSSKEHVVCILCNNVAKEPRNVESSKTKYNIKYLLLKYGGINVEASKICVLWVGKLYSLHEKTRAFYSFCQASHKLKIHQTKRMASSPSERLSKRKTIAETPTKRHCSKIPTPVKVYE